MLSPILMLASTAFGRDVDLKVHDMKGVVTGEVTVEIGEPGKEPAKYVCRDDGIAPDAVAGDRLYTSRVNGLAVDHGAVVVRAGDRTWQGGFRFDNGSDPVLLIGLEDGGFAAASTREVMFLQQDRMETTGQEMPGHTAGVPGGAPGSTVPTPGPDAGATGTPTTPSAAAGGDSTVGWRAPTRTGLPPGMAFGWVLAAGALAGLGAVTWASARRAPRLAPLRGDGPRTTATRGPLAPAEGRTDLYVGPGDGLAVGEGRWTPDEIALAALRVRGPTRVVVTDAARVEVEGDGYPALAAALAGVADLLWVHSAPGQTASR